MTKAFSTTELRALDILRHVGGSMLITSIPDRNEFDVHGDVIPGMAVYRKLDKKGLVVICDALIDDDGFEWTPAVELI